MGLREMAKRLGMLDSDEFPQTYQVDDDAWVTATNRRIPVARMEDRHLLNSHRMLREWERDLARVPRNVHSGIDRLSGEIDKRNLAPLPLTGRFWFLADGRVMHT